MTINAKSARCRQEMEVPAANRRIEGRPLIESPIKDKEREVTIIILLDIGDIYATILSLAHGLQ